MSGHFPAHTKFAVDVVAIDLDGTLVDTAEDLALAANGMLSLLALPAVSEAVVRGFIGQGVASLVRRCLEHASGGHSTAAEVASARELFERMYEAGRHQRSRVYDGVFEGLDALAAAGLRLCCITNKAGRFTVPLLTHVGLAPRFELVLSGDSLPRAKPDPLPIVHAAMWFGVEVSRVLLVGDSPHDTGAARAAGCPVICVDYGYCGPSGVASLDCDAVVGGLHQLPALLNHAR